MLTTTDAARLRAGAGRAADLLVENAITAGGRSTWLGVALGADAPAVYRTADATLYDGSAGIAMAAWQVAAGLRRNDLAEVALGAARHAVSARARIAGIGLFDGLAGIGLAALELGHGAGDERLRRDGIAILDHVAEAAAPDADLISGGAGVVLALLAAAHRTASDRWLSAAVRHGEQLLAAACRHPWGWSWPSRAGEGAGLCGLAHGAAGVAWALGALASASGDDRFAEAVDGARRYERSWFHARESNWPDLRAAAGAAGAPLAYPALWCHGATGIGMTRLALFRLARHPSLAAEAAVALQAATAAARAFGEAPAAGVTLCHGLGGTLLLLLAAHAVLDEPEHLDAARWLADQALDRIGDDPADWPSGMPGGAFSPGLMTGLAGSMYAFARVADPAATGGIAVLGDLAS